MIAVALALNILWGVVSRYLCWFPYRAMGFGYDWDILASRCLRVIPGPDSEVLRSWGNLGIP